MDLEARVRQAVKYFWSTRERQAAEQGGESGKKDTGARAAVTGGRQMDGFVRLVRDVLFDNGIKQGEIIHERRLEIPGWYRAERRDNKHEKSCFMGADCAPVEIRKWPPGKEL